MNVLTNDLISIIASRNYSIVRHKFINSWFMLISYLDQNGNYHRVNGPAKIWDDGVWRWYFHGKHHRDRPKPAMTTYDYYVWYNMGELIAKRKK